MSLKDITLLCLTYERHNLLLNSARYWNEVGDIKVIYADGSNLPCKVLIDKYPNIKYFHMPNKSMQERGSFLAENSQTKYSCQICDDEFFIPSALEECLTFLENMPDYISCIGNAIGFKKFAGRIVFLPAYRSFFKRKLNSEDPRKRLLQHFSNYECTHSFALTRTEKLKKALQISFDLEIFALEEIVFECVIAILGKSKVLDNLYWLRNYEIPYVTNSGDKSLNRKKLLYEWWINASKEEREKKFIFKIIQAADNRIEVKDVEDAIEAFIVSTKSDIKIFNSFKKVIKDKFPYIYKIFVQNYIFFKRFKQKKLNNIQNNFFPEGELHLLLKKGIKIDSFELSKIKEYIFRQ